MTEVSRPQPGEVAAVVLAAGWSSRMGAFKPLLSLAGDTVVGRVIASLKAAGIDRVLVVAGHEAGRLAPVVEAHGATVFVEAKAVLFLLGTEMDFEQTPLRTGFVFRNPNQVGSCGCGESVSLKPAEPAEA